jgi:hypothetical protein
MAEDASIELCGDEGSDRLVKLIVMEDEAWRTTYGGGNSCGVARLVLGPPFIRQGWCEAAHRGIESADRGPASMRSAFTASAGSDGFEIMGS